MRNVGSRINIEELYGMTMRDLRTPEQRLLISVLDRAVRDFCADRFFISRPEAADASYWLTSNSRTIFSCRWICEHLGLDHSRLQTALKSPLRLSSK